MQRTGILCQGIPKAKDNDNLYLCQNDLPEMIEESTICAISTPPGNGAIAIVRLSGKEALSITSKVFSSRNKNNRLAEQAANTIHFGTLADGTEIIDEVLVSIFKAPHSYTGEDLVEISCHGSEYIQQRILQLLIKNGAKHAGPGEFTMRAFLNRKMDLSQAEAVADLIASDAKGSHQLAIRQMRGGFSREIAGLREKLLHFISMIELELDFGEEDVEFADRTELVLLLGEIKELTQSLIDSFQKGNVIKNGVPVAITGKPNVGKSTLLNYLLNEDKAIVSHIAGTTRDVIEDVLTIDEFRFRLIDTAGLRKTRDTIESLGIEKTYEKIDKAYIILYLIDANQPIAEINRLIGKIKKRMGKADKKLVVLLNKVDFLTEKELNERKLKKNFPQLDKEDHLLCISAKNKYNLKTLYALLPAIVRGKGSGQQDVIVTNTRHFEALTRAKEALDRAVTVLDTGMSSDFLAMDIREVLHYLGEITGQITTDEVLGNIFKNFCIGK